MRSNWCVPLLAMSVLLTGAATTAAAGEPQRETGRQRAAAAAMATPVASYDLPFGCEQEWVGGTRSRHSPSRYAVDFNRSGDLGKPVVASAAGTVTVAQRKPSGGYGKYVVIDHGNGDSTLYAHLGQVFVHAGSRVDHGMLVGAVGSTGNSSGAHLHYEQKVGRTVVPAHVRRAPYAGGAVLSGNCVDVPVAGNLVEGPAAEVAVFRRTARSGFLTPSADPAAPTTTGFGVGIDEPVVGDWDGDGRDDLGVWSPRGRTFKLRGPDGATTRIRHGARADRPVVGDWDGDGRADVGVFRASTGQFLLRSAAGVVTPVGFGRVGDVPVVGDWDGDGRADVGVFDPASAVFSLRLVDASGVPTAQSVPFGTPGDLPVVADWDGDGRTDLGVWSPSTGTFQQRQAPQAAAPARAVVTVAFGNPR